MVAPSIAVLPACTIFSARRFGTSPMRFAALHIDVPPEPSRQVKNVNIVKVDPVCAEDRMQSCHVRALGLGQLVYIALQQVDFVLRVSIEIDPAQSVLESPVLIHPAGAQQLAQRVDQAGAANPLGSSRRRSRQS